MVRAPGSARAGARAAAGLRPAHPRRRQRIVGAIFRIAAEGEWRTNIALGGSRRPVADPPPQACEIALAAAHAAGTALVGVDLVQDGLGGWTVLELNGAVEFTREYQPAGDVFADVAAELPRQATATLAAAAAA